jgi:hypothetical protein
MLAQQPFAIPASAGPVFQLESGYNENIGPNTWLS